MIKSSLIYFTSCFPIIVFQPSQHYSSSAPGPNTASSTSPSTPPLPTDDCQCPPHVMAQVWVRNGRGMQDSKSLDEISQACGGKSESVSVSVYVLAHVLAPHHLPLQRHLFLNQNDHYMGKESHLKCFHVLHSWSWWSGRGQSRPVGGPTGHNLLCSGAGRDGQSRRRPD